MLCMRDALQISERAHRDTLVGSGGCALSCDSQASLLTAALLCRQDLFSPFGPISRIYIAYDRDTGEARGFAFVNFVYSQDAQRAIEKLDGCALQKPYNCICVQPGRAARH